jgi:hypothetical protein
MLSAGWAWVLLILGNAAWITPYDMWLHFHHKTTMTSKMHYLIFESQWAQFIIPGVAALTIWFIVHEIKYHPHR